MIRQTVHFTGRVQGVGFRYTTREIASRHAVGGYVRNLDDGRVLLVAEGKANDVAGFVEDVCQTMRRYITAAKVDESPASGEFAFDFTIRH